MLPLNVLLLLLAAGQVVMFVDGVESSVCDSYRYMYTLQPPEAIVCNPYRLGILNLTCAVSGELVDDIQWYYRPTENGEAILLTNDSQVTIIPSNFEGDYSVIMTIRELNLGNLGFYWCQGLVQHEDLTLELSRSHEFQLLTEDRYFPFDCPRKAHKNSAVRCAAVVPADPPVVSSSLGLPEHSSTVELLLPLDQSSTIDSTPSLPLSPTTTSSRFTSASLGLQPSSAPTSDPTSSEPSQQPPTGSQSDTTQPPPLDQQSGNTQLSDIILYAILALLGCLVLLVLSLSVVISVICCKKRRKGLQGKDAPYDQFSTESEALHGTLTLKSLDTYPITPPPPPPYRLPLHISHSDTMTSSSSGVYDEIHTVMSQYGTQQCMLATHHYQEIPVVHVDSGDRSGAESPPGGEPCTLDSALGGESETDTPHQLTPGENPYDLPDQLTQHTHAVGSSSQPQPSDSYKDPTTAPDLHNYHLLEQPSISVEQVDTRSSMDDSSEFTNSNLQVTPPPEDDHGCSHGGDVGMELSSEMAIPHIEIVVESMDAVEEESPIPLPAIPENPYHILEQKQASTRSNRHTMLQNGPSGAQNHQAHSESSESRPVPPPQILHGLSMSMSEDEGYDRLVGPPHLYHILQKSPSLIRPRVRECSPTSGYHHLDNRMEPGAQSPQSGDHLHASFPLLDEVLPSEGSSVVSGSELFDDPQYNFSSKREINGGGSSSKSHRNSHSGQFTTLERAKMEKGIDLSKYRGDYERDPTYMKLIQRLTEASKQSSDEPTRTQEESDRTEVGAALAKNMASSKSSSLPDIAHTYQSLQTLTRDPLRNYELLHKGQLSSLTAEPATTDT